MNRKIVSYGLLTLAIICGAANAKVYFSEKFDDGEEGLKKRWVMSTVKDAEGTAGKFELGAGKFFVDEAEDTGLRTSEDARFYIASAEMPEEFTNKDKTLIFQYQIKQDQLIDCGGGYLKLIPAGAMKDGDQKLFAPSTDYNIMFGPDICGGGTKRTHLIFSHGGENHLIKKSIKCETDDLSHLYTLILRPDNTYEVKIDNVQVQTGNLEEDWAMVPPRRIPDPEASKPKDWVNEPDMPDPEDVKPADWDDVPARIPDPEATKPEDWDEEIDGEWEPPTIDNPLYKGPWAAKRIPNPDYKGPWKHPEIDNPDYKPNPELYAYPSFKYVGIEIWQVKSGSIFDNILVTDDEAVAAEWGSKFEEHKAAEKEARDKYLEEQRLKDEEEAKRVAEEAEKEKEKSSSSSSDSSDSDGDGEEAEKDEEPKGKDEL